MSILEDPGKGSAVGLDGAPLDAAAKPLSTRPHQYRYNADGSGGQGPKFMRTEVLLGRESEAWLDRAITAAAEKIIGIGEINRICLEAGTPWPASSKMIEHVFRKLGVKWQVTNPKMFDKLEGKPAVFVANHPYGMADAFAMNNLLEERRPNFRLFANSFLTATDSITHKLLFVDPFMNETSRAMNRRSMMAALKHLKEGGDLALFPGRLCSHLKWGEKRVQDGEWTDQVRIFVAQADANLVPIHVSGRNSWRFQTAGLIHPKLRTLLIMREFIRGGHDFTFTLGEPISADTIIKAGKVAAPGQIARALTYAANPTYRAKLDEALPAKAASRVAVSQTQAAKSSRASLTSALAKHPVLVSQKGLKVFDVQHGLPAALEGEIAKLRFDAYGGEASVASPADLIDRFDSVYSHLILWDEEAKRLIGSYRYLIPSRLNTEIDQRDLVTGSIFKLQRPFLDILPRAFELGRAAISADSQRSYAPLMMMWRGIMSILNADKSLKYLIGPVTVPGSFSPMSRHVLRHFIERHRADAALSGYAVPHKPFEAPIPPEVNIEDLLGQASTIPQVASIIEALEAGQRKLPVLYRQYDNMGLKYVATGDWPELDNAMASLSVLDIAKGSRNFISRYLPSDELDAFFDR